jgi:YHS domain-containing protein
MTQHLPISRQWITETAAVLALALPAAIVAAPAEAGLFPSGSVYPRAAVSSDAYRTPPQLLASTAAQPLVVQHRGQTAAQQTARDTHVRHVDHQEFQQASGTAAGYSVQAELQRLYAEEGREMPQMAMPSHRPASNTAHTRPPAGNRAASSAREQREERPSGLLAGLFDFGRSRTPQRSTGVITQPPVEPQPFHPPTYRQQQARRPQANQTPERRMANSPAQQQQPAAQTMPSNSVFELQRVTPGRHLATQGDAFFPEDGATVPEAAGLAETPSQGMTGEGVDELAEFFPGEVAASPKVAATEDTPTADTLKADTSGTDAAGTDTTKEKMQQLFQEHSQTNEGGFQMPIETEQDVLSEPAPAAASALVTTTITPLPEEGPAEPAPFFAAEERAIDPQESMEVSALVGQTFDPSGADSHAASSRAAHGQAAGSKMQQIAARGGVGLKGYCPVALRDERHLADGKAAYVSYYQGKAYYFSSDAAKVRFDASPSAYAPASGGEDVTMKTLSGEVIEGSLDHSVWYKGRLYLFHTAENLKTFMAAPSAMALAE